MSFRRRKPKTKLNSCNPAAQKATWNQIKEELTQPDESADDLFAITANSEQINFQVSAQKPVCIERYPWMTQLHAPIEKLKEGEGFEIPVAMIYDSESDKDMKAKRITHFTKELHSFFKLYYRNISLGYRQVKQDPASLKKDNPVVAIRVIRWSDKEVLEKISSEPRPGRIEASYLPESMTLEQAVTYVNKTATKGINSKDRVGTVKLSPECYRMVRVHAIVHRTSITSAVNDLVLSNLGEQMRGINRN